MSNNDNNKQQLDPESLLVFDKAQAPSTTTVNVGDVDLGFPEINHVAAAPQNLVQSAEAPPTTTPTVNKLDHDGISLVERRSRDVKPREKNESLGISGFNQQDEASTSTPITDRITEVNQTPYYVDKGYDETIDSFLDRAKSGQNRGNQYPPSICKVSRILRDHNESSYEPLLVSIGPIHREDPKLQEFERQKACYLNELLKRCHDSTPKKTLEACLQKVNVLIPRIRVSYSDDVIKNYSDVELARMMVMDGCFILEFCFKHEQENLYLPNKMQNTRIAMDLVLLENQVPFFVLQDLFDCLAPYIFRKKWSVTLSEVLDKYLAPYINLFRQSHETNSTTNVLYDHVLGYLHKLYHLEAAKSLEAKHTESWNLEAAKSLEAKHTESWNRIMDESFHSIVELDRYGMNFKCHQEEWAMTIKFQQYNSADPLHTPALLMPALVIDDTTELILRNFIAYEQSFPQGRYYFTSYAHVMNKLIDSKEDIAKLVESKVLVNNLGSNQEAADMINKICKNISITDFYYTQEFKQMDNYYSGKWSKNFGRVRGILRDDPWSYYSQCILFYLAVVQTIYTIRAA